MRELSESERHLFDTPQSSQGRYNWALWTNGHFFAAKAGEDFTSKVASFTYLLRAQAQRRNLHVEIRTLESGEIGFRFTKPASEESEESAESESESESETEPRPKRPPVGPLVRPSRPRNGSPEKPGLHNARPGFSGQSKGADK